MQEISFLITFDMKMVLEELANVCLIAQIMTALDFYWKIDCAGRSLLLKLTREIL